MFDKIIAAMEKLANAINRACDLYEKGQTVTDSKNPFLTKDGLYNYKNAIPQINKKEEG